jgi:hypothetical protein
VTNFWKNVKKCFFTWSNFESSNYLQPNLTGAVTKNIIQKFWNLFSRKS